jgi:schlafen family protein
MLWEGRALRDIREADIRRLAEVGLQEHLQLEYKSALYEDNDRGHREFLQDICMFANSVGGVLLLGVSERRDERGQPTGSPDPAAPLGIELPNPEVVLAAYDARITAAVEERLPVEMAAIDLGQGRRVVAIRVPDSVRKPHAVSYQGRVYFPGRRERQRYSLSVREIKELTMRTASRLQQSEESLKNALTQVTLSQDRPYLIAGILPVFFEDFLVDLRNENLRLALSRFSRTGQGEFGNITYSFHGMERRHERFDHIVQFGRNGLLRISQQLPLIPRDGVHQAGPKGIDSLFRYTVVQAPSVYEAAGIGPPYVATIMLRIQRPLTGVYAALGGGEEHTQPVQAGDYRFPFMQIDDLASVNRILRPFCDQVHQMFGKEGSPGFDVDGEWIGA